MASVRSSHLRSGNSGLEPGAHERASPMQLGLARAFGDPEHLRCLSVRVTVDAAEHERITRAVGQTADRGFDLVHFDWRIKRPLLGRARRLLARVRRHWRQFDLRRNLAAPIKDYVYRDAVQPSPEAASGLEAPERSPCIEKRLLCAVLRGGPLARHPQTKSVHASNVIAIEALECAYVATASPLHQACLPFDPVTFCSRDHAVH